MKKGYYYLFYQLYKFWDYVSVPKFWSDMKACIVIAILKIFLFSSMLYYFDINIAKNQVLFFGIVFIFLPDVYLFLINDDWKSYFKEFESYPQNKRRKYTFITWGIILLILINFIISLNYLLDN